MTATAPIGVGVIGMGFMGQTHVRAYQNAGAAGLPCALVAICDLNQSRLTGDSSQLGNLQVDRDGGTILDAPVCRCGDVDQLLRDERVQIVSICTYTDTHVDLAMRSLAAGKHVLVEKPVALRSQDVQRLAEAARRARTLCMPAMCMRFWPAWNWLHDRIVDRSLGKVRSAVFQRLGSRPAWTDFYADESRSGGALFDLHIHDVDFIHWCFGRPQSIASAGSINHFTTLYRYDNGPAHVAAEAAWDLQPSAGFRMKYVVAFEHATADFDLGRTPPLLLHHPDRSEPIEVGPLTGYDIEIREFVAAIRDGRRDLRATLDDAVVVTEMLEAERARLSARG